MLKIFLLSLFLPEFVLSSQKWICLKQSKYPQKLFPAKITNVSIPRINKILFFFSKETELRIGSPREAIGLNVLNLSG